MKYLNQPTKSKNLAALARGSAAPSADPYLEGTFEREDEYDSVVLEYFRILRRHKALIVISSLAGLALGGMITVIQPRVYQAITSLEVLNLNENFMNLKQSNPLVDGDSHSNDTSEVQTQVKILQNEDLVDRVTAKLDPDFSSSGPHAPVKSPVAGWRAWLKMSPPAKLTAHQRLVQDAAKSVKVRAAPRARIIEVTIDSTDPQLASDFANALDNEFIEQNLQARWNTSQNIGKWLGHELGDARSKLAQAEDALQNYARNTALIFTGDDKGVATEKLQQIQQQLSAVTADRIAKQSQYELAQSAPADALPEVLNDQGYRDTQAKLNDLRRQVAELSAIYNPDYSKLKQLQAQVASLDAAIERNRGDIVSRIKNDYISSLRRESLLATSYDTQTREVTGQGEKAIQYNILKREVESSRQLYDTMLQQLKLSSIAGALSGSNVRILKPAKPPRSPLSSGLPIYSVLGTFLGFVASAGIVLIRDYTDRTLQQPGESQFWTNIPELGAVPSMRFNVIKIPKTDSWIKTSAALPGRSLISAGSSKESAETITWEQSASLMAEAFRTIVTSILLKRQGITSPRVLVFTSAAPGDGKTTVVSNLGIAFAEIGRRVLIVDADLRRPRQHQIFGAQNNFGLSTLLTSRQSSSASWRSLVQDTKIPGLCILPAGPEIQTTSSLLHSARLTDLLYGVKSEYDIVLIDTPPMLHLTDARVLGRLVDGVIFVARAEQTPRDALIAATKRFGEDRIRVLGTVLNDWNPKRSLNGYYGYYR